MAALMIIPIIGLSAFLLIAKSIFEKDKIAYVYDSSLSVSKTRAARVSSEVSSVISIAQAIVLSYRSDTKNLSETGTYYFDREMKFDAFQVFAWNTESSSYSKNVNLAKPFGQKLLPQLDRTIDEMLSQSRQMPIIVRGVDGTADRVLLAARFGEPNDPRHVISIVLFEASDLAQIFSEQGPYISFLAKKGEGKAFFHAPQTTGDWTPEAVSAALFDKNIPEGIEEIRTSSGARFLASFSEVGVSNLMVVSMVERRVALAAVETLLKKSILFFIAVISFTLVLSVVAARGMTSALRSLSTATTKVAQGDFGVRVDARAGGEIGVLAKSFNAMAGEIARLMRETAEKARMETELATAKTVQETLFPEGFAKLGSIEIAGHYEPASECGGDWWYYCENDGKVYIWIGDATGHGAPAALLTSAARAVASVLTFGPPCAVSECLTILNRAIHETSKGRMMMTFFLACIDTKTGELTYANASHEPPLLLRKMDSEPSRDDFVPLNEVNNPRLGEQHHVQFKETRVWLAPGDCIMFYTDGVVDVKNSESKNWGERRFLKAAASTLHQSFHTVDSQASAANALEKIVGDLQGFRNHAPLDDDVTLVLCRYLPEAVSRTEAA